MLSIHSSPLGRLGSADTGGMSVYLLELASELGGRGHQVDIFTRRVAPDSERVIECAPNVRVITLGVSGTEDLTRSALFEHLNSFCSAIDGFVRQKGATYDLVHSNYWLSGVIGEQLKTRWNCPHVVTFHTVATGKMAALDGHVEDRNRIQEETRLLRYCDGVIVPTEAEGRHLASLINGETASIYHVPWGVNMDHFKAADCSATRHETTGSCSLVLFVGRFDPMKGIDLAVRGVSRLVNDREIKLLIIGGDGPKSTSCQEISQLADDLGISDRVQLLGPIEHSQMVLYYQKADVVVVSSRYESFGLVILEALACGTPVAATPVGIAPHVIEPGKNGYLAAAGDDQSLAEAIAGALALAEWREAEQIRQSVSEFTWSNAARSTVDVYAALLTNT